MEKQKQNVAAQSNAETEDRAMMIETCELVWIIQLLTELKFAEIVQMELNQTALHIASKLEFYIRIKHIEIDYHFIREWILSGDIVYQNL